MDNILKQTIASMRQQPLLTTLSVVGTALAIAIIMIVMMTREVKLTDYGNEPNRSRTLYVTSFYQHGPQQFRYDTDVSPQMQTNIFNRMKSPECVARYTSTPVTLDAYVAGRENVNVATKAVNAAFFRVFTLDFKEGRPFTHEVCESNEAIALISQDAARRLFGQEDGLSGRTFFLANHEYRVAGIIKNVSNMFASAYADVWVPAGLSNAEAHPLAATALNPSSGTVALLARSKDDFPQLRAEVSLLLLAYNQSIAPDTLSFAAQPDDQETFNAREWAGEDPDIASERRNFILIFVILLVVPAINIASMTQSRLRQRRKEIGVRRAFGAKRSQILWQVFAESLVQSAMASVVGLLLCFALCCFATDFIFQNGDNMGNVSKMNFDFRILFSPAIYAWTVFFCLVLNLLSSIVPAWRACRADIVESLK